MGIMDRDWYRERFARRVVGIEGPLDDPMGEPARARRGVQGVPRVPRGAEPGEFWVWVFRAAVAVGVVVMLLRWWRG